MRARKCDSLAAVLRQAWIRRELTFNGDAVGGLALVPHHSTEQERQAFAEFFVSVPPVAVNPDTGGRIWSF